MSGVVSNCFPGQSRRAFIRLAWLYRTITSPPRLFTGDSLAMEYEVSKKQIERDIETLRESGAIETVLVRNTSDQSRGLYLGRPVVAHQCPFCGEHKNAKNL